MSLKLKIAVIIPCLNENITIGKVVKDFSKEIKDADIYVVDNGSSDNSAEIAAKAGALVINESKRGKGNALSRAFSHVDADLFLIVDGDGTYDPKYASKMITLLIEEGLDMVVASRQHTSDSAYREGHQLGNKIFNKLFSILFGKIFSDIFSGYRALSAPFVKSFPVFSRGFEIETEMSVHAVNLKLPTAEIKVPYYPRPHNSNSKLSTYKDGIKIFLKMLMLFRTNRPFVFYGIISLTFTFISGIILTPLLVTYFKTGLVPRFPTLIVVVGSIIMSALVFFTGLILQTMVEFQGENRRLAYLSIKQRLQKK